MCSSRNEYPVRTRLVAARRQVSGLGRNILTCCDQLIQLIACSLSVPFSSMWTRNLPALGSSVWLTRIVGCGPPNPAPCAPLFTTRPPPSPNFMKEHLPRGEDPSAPAPDRCRNGRICGTRVGLSRSHSEGQLTLMNQCSRNRTSTAALRVGLSGLSMQPT